MALPDFTSQQRSRLQALGLCVQQIEKLRVAVAISAPWLNRPPARNDILDLLDEVENLSRQLATRLGALAIHRDMAHSAAHGLIEERYWAKRPEDYGPTASHNMVPRLDALAHSAHEAKEALPKEQARARAYVQPIRNIDNAMRDGWRNAHGTGVRSSDAPVKTPPSYPRKFCPSASPTSTFRQICGICYEMAGYGDNADPERALKAYMRWINRDREDALAAIERTLASSSSYPKDSRPSRK